MIKIENVETYQPGAWFSLTYVAEPKVKAKYKGRFTKTMTLIGKTGVDYRHLKTNEGKFFEKSGSWFTPSDNPKLKHKIVYNKMGDPYLMVFPKESTIKTVIYDNVDGVYLTKEEMVKLGYATDAMVKPGEFNGVMTLKLSGIVETSIEDEKVKAGS